MRHSFGFCAFAVLLLAGACGGKPNFEPRQVGDPSPGGNGGNGQDRGGQAGEFIVDIGGEGGKSGSGNQAGNAGSGPTSICGDSSVDEDEECDDGNDDPGDGCDRLCRVENGYECEEPGEPCEYILFCGDGEPGPNEACDDGNQDSSDGCSEECRVEVGFTCPEFGEPCVPTVTPPECGNSSIDAGETCDDGNEIASDGCSDTCQREEGYSCPRPGEPCQEEITEYCGDGAVNTGEECDDGNARGGDCCDGTCHLESNCVCEDPPEPIEGAAQTCHSTIECGDSEVTGSEICDDGNQTSGDGCSGNCSNVEPGYSCPTTGGPCSEAVNPCGNAQIDGAEECDDGQSPMTSGDGCSAACELEPGWVCPTPGTACQRVEYCGDGIVSYPRGETCDDAQDPPADNDGCSATCTVESYWRCTGAPSTCEYTVVCGNRRIDPTEGCDDNDNPPANGDGCSATCQLEEGYTCTAPGIACQPTCGDGLLRGRETCDDGDTESGDGCSSSCVVETPGPGERDGWICPTPGEPCERTQCGDGTPQGSEQCDDGNNNMGDGCTPFCRKEPSCPAAGGPCTTACGDGIILEVDKNAGQECDDGNTVSGDGCSATCTIEDGFECPDVTDDPDTLILPIVLRDFDGDYEEARASYHPDHEIMQGGWAGYVPEQGIVQNRLDADGKPVHVTQNMEMTSNEYDAGVLTSEDYFAAWYRDVPKYNQTFLQTLTLNRVAGGYEYDNRNFYPLTDLGWGNYYEDRNYHFTSEVRYYFEYSGGETLRFRGDDDVWVFVNKRLAVDLGGVHNAEDGTVTLNASDGTGVVCDDPDDEQNNCDDDRTVDFELELGSVYEMVVFQAERHILASNYRLTLGNFAVTHSDCGPICGDGVVTADEQCDLGRDLNTGDYGGCNDDCTLAPYCGDSNTDTGEECDNGLNTDSYGSRTGCAMGCVLPPYCGDGTRDTDYGETCDQGAENSDTAYGLDLCTSTCEAAPFCGDGLTNGDETCDDGADNGTPQSPCGVDCRPACGNGVIDAGEQCDDGADNNDGRYGGCRSDCRYAPYCGNGVKEGAEECDDGKNDGSYGTCNVDCTLAPYCGDGTQDPNEACDAGDNNQVNGYGEGICTTRCQPAPYCGDYAVDVDHGEVCDDGEDASDTEPGACKTDCSGYNPPPVSCGNGNIDPGEDCDDGDDNGTPGSACDVRCQFKCGNGIKEEGEECDDGVNDGSYGTCQPDCTYAPYCGDNHRDQPEEECDKGDDNERNPYGPNKCTLECKLAPYCGDDRVQSPPEKCDGQSGCDGNCEWSIPELE